MTLSPGIDQKVFEVDERKWRGGPNGGWINRTSARVARASSSLLLKRDRGGEVPGMPGRSSMGRAASPRASRGDPGGAPVASRGDFWASRGPARISTTFFIDF